MTHQRAIEAGARADAEFDGRTWLAMPKHERDRYLARSQSHHARLAAEGLVVVPAEPARIVIDRAVAFALNVSLTGDYNWSAYMTDLYRRMVTAAQQEQNDA